MSKKILLVAGLLCAIAGGTSAQEVVMSVDEILHRIAANNADVRSAKSNYEAVSRGIDVAKSALLPQVSASLDLNYIGDGTILDRDFTNAMRDKLPQFGNTLNVNLYQPIYQGGAISAGIDLARVERQIVPVNSRVQGFVSEVRFNDYTFVHRGDTLVVIDDAEFRLRLAQAHADLQNASTGKAAMNSSISTTQNNVAVNEAAIAEVRVLLDNAETDLRRYEALLAKEAVTQQQYDGIKANRDALKAKYETMTRQRNSTSMVAGEQRVRLGQNDAAIEIAQAALHLAELNLSYTVITAPCDGYCSRKSLQAGQLVQPGQTLVEIVDANDVWVVANYKEKQTSDMKVGDKVAITVDAVPGVTFHGEISDISAATGEAYSARPHANAVGNFVKVEQRIPVKIRFSGDNQPEQMARLRSGMNVECKLVK